MDKQSFRQMGYEIIDWIADYMESGYDGPVNPPVKPGAMRAQLPKSAPEQPESPAQIMADFKSMILPNTLHWNDPRFYGYFPCNHSGPAILGDLLGNGLGVNAMSWATCPSATELEIQVMQWLGKAIGLEWPGVIQDTASTGVFCALLAARESVANGNRDGFYDSAPLVAYTSDQAHSSLLKAMRMAGLGDRYMRLVPTLEDQSMDTDVLVRMIEGDIEAGHRPFFICGTIGTTSTTAVDPILEISEIADEYDIWFHVDAALAGTAALLPEMEWLMEGVEQADSFLFNPHKWMFTSFDCCAFFIKDPAALKHALSIQPEYLKTAADGAVENFRDWSIQLGRRFRALKLWFVLRLYGLEGIREKIRLHLAMTQDFARWVED
ncbi:MAG: aspartate aminotransferase family protein, partial [Acidobacteria bacterium]|nr:aspartate aminotransferase family protein [Acidobacteriota bacterium]